MVNKKLHTEECKRNIMAVNDAMYVLSGKWKIQIIASMCFNAERRFSDILHDVKGISNKMLSKELKEMEVNKLVTRTVFDTQPPTVKYKLSDYGKSLQDIIQMLSEWGMKHRKMILGK